MGKHPLEGFQNKAAVIDFVRKVYGNRSVGVQQNLYRALSSGSFANTGKLIVGAADQMRGVHNCGMYAPWLDLFDPAYIYELFSQCGVSIAALHPEAIKSIPYEARLKSGLGLMWKINAQNGIDKSLTPQLNGTVKEAVELGCIGIGYTLNNTDQLYELTQISAEAHAYGLPVYVWAYGRHDGIKGKEQAVDTTITVICQALDGGADVIKAKPTKKNLLLDEDAINSYFANYDLADAKVRAKLVKAACNGRLLVPSGGEPGWGDKRPASEEAWLEGLTETASIVDGGAIGRYLTTQKDIPTAVAFMRQIEIAFASGWNG